MEKFIENSSKDILQYVNKQVKLVIENVYLDYVNNYLTLDKMSEDYNIPIEELSSIIELGKKFNNK